MNNSCENFINGTYDNVELNPESESNSDSDLDNITDETLIREDENGIVFLNIFLIYYRQLFNKKDTNIFNEVNYDNTLSTNRYMEYMYEHICKYNENINNEDKIKVYSLATDVNINECEELYQLIINNKESLYCRYIVPLIYELSDMDWLNIKWDIISLK